MDTERLFYRGNGLLCLGAAAALLWSAGLFGQRTLEGPAKLDRELEALLRDLAAGGPHFVLLVSYLPVLIVISVMLAFYLYLHRRARYLSLLALLSGILLSGLLLMRQIASYQLTSLALQYVATTQYTARGELFQEARRLLDLYLLHGLLVSRTSIVAYALYGFLFQKSRSLLEVLTGYFFLLSALALLVEHVLTAAGRPPDLPIASGLSALAFVLAAGVLFRARSEQED